MEEHSKTWSDLTASDLGMDKQAIEHSFASHVEYTQGKDEHTVTKLDFFMSVAMSARDRLYDRWNKTQSGYYETDAKRVYYLSLEFLIGRLLKNALISLGILDQTREALRDFGVDLDAILEEEMDAGLGNGGLGRLAACYLDSMATLGIPAIGYGIRYEYGIFRQILSNGEQVEVPDSWLRYGNPWEIGRPEFLFPVKFYGTVRTGADESGRLRFDWVDTQIINAMAYDIPVPGYKNGVVNTLRLWSAKASREFDFANFNRGDYIQSVQDKNASENLSRVLYPNDQVWQGRELRLKQEYFFVSATLQDAIRRHLKIHGSVSNLHEKAVFQLNDTHPTLAIPELMRLLMDEHGLGWDEAWGITEKAFAYTNHTVMSEALETWSMALVESMLPRHIQIIYEINRRFLERVRSRFPGDEGRAERMSIVAEGPERKVRMANLAVVGSSSVNGVSELHSRLLRERLFRDFFELWPDKFKNVTNGITPRRWLLACNRPLSDLLTTRLGEGWARYLGRLEKLAPLTDDPTFRSEWRKAKQANKDRLARYIRSQCGVEVDPESLFDVQVKRLHEYKRQLLNALHVLKLHRDLKEGRGEGRVPRTVIFGGKAAPGYEMAKRIIRLINAVADHVNRDPDTNRRLKAVFIPNYSVSVAEVIMPAADLSEQISLAGTEASGTGNMKFALNGALTIGTLDGANIEIREAVGEDNIFIFGLKDAEVEDLRQRGYRPEDVYASDPELRAIIDFIGSGALSGGDPSVFRPIVDRLLREGDYFMVLADFRSYCECQRRVDEAFLDREGWTRQSILNVARMGRFSSDMSITRYAHDIWGLPLSPQAGSYTGQSILPPPPPRKRPVLRRVRR